MIAGKYRVERVLGAGGMGVVVEAFHLSLDEKVAIKYLKPEALENSASVARFAREARASAKIKSEHVCRVLDVLVDEGVPYLVMEYLEGRDLDNVVSKEGTLSVEDGVDYILQACEALAEAHVAGIVHRDLKPANLFLSKRADGSPVVKVLDFGISKVQPRPGGHDAAMTATSSLLGSPLYMSPEQMKATKDVDARTDIWSMGVILYEVLTALRPFTGETIPAICAQILSEPPLPLAGRVPPAVEAVILRCLEKRPEDRFQSVAELAEALRPIAPMRSTLSIDRVVRVIAQSSRGGPASQSGPQSTSSPGLGAIGAGAGAEAWSSPTVEASSIAAPLPLLPARTADPSGTQAAFESRVAERPARVGRVVLAAGAVLLVVGAATLFVALRVGPRSQPGAPTGVASPMRADTPPIPAAALGDPTPPPPRADPPPLPLPAGGATPSAATQPALAPPATAAPPPATPATTTAGPDAAAGKPRPPTGARPPVGKSTGLPPPPVPVPPPVKPGFGGRD